MMTSSVLSSLSSAKLLWRTGYKSLGSSMAMRSPLSCWRFVLQLNRAWPRLLVSRASSTTPAPPTNNDSRSSSRTRWQVYESFGIERSQLEGWGFKSTKMHELLDSEDTDNRLHDALSYLAHVLQLNKPATTTSSTATATTTTTSKKPLLAPLAAVLRMMPKDLKRARLEENVGFLLNDMRLSPDELPRLLSRWPMLLTTSVETLRSKASMMRRLGVSDERIRWLLPRRGSVLTFGESTLENKIAELSKLVVIPPGSIARLVGKGSLAGCSLARLNQRVQLWLDAGMTREEVGKLLSRHPSLLQSNTQMLLAKIEYLRSLGFDQQALPHVLLSISPALTCALESNIIPKVAFLRANLDPPTEPAEFAAWLLRHSPLLTCSLEGRLKPRLAYLDHLASTGKPISREQRWSIFSGTDPQFARRFGATLEHYNDFKQSFLATSAKTTNSKPTTEATEEVVDE